MKKTAIPGLIYAVLSFAFGLLLIVLGFQEASVDTTVPVDEAVFDHMMLTVPGILLILDSGIFGLRNRLFRSSPGFLFGNAGLFFLLGLILEIVYFQFFYFGLSRPQPKLIVGTLPIILLYTVAVLIATTLFELTRRHIAGIEGAAPAHKGGKSGGVA